MPKTSINIVDKARIFSKKKHDETGALYNNEPYFIHPELVATIISLVTDNDNVIAAAYLHDTLEDTDTTYEELVQEFNTDIASLVREVTKQKVDGVKLFPDLKTRRGVLIKFADRLANLSNMDVWDKDRQQKYLDSSKFWVTEL